MTVQSEGDAPPYESCTHPESAPVHARVRARGRGQTKRLGRLCLECQAIFDGLDGQQWQPADRRQPTTSAFDSDSTAADERARITISIKNDGYELREVVFDGRGGKVRGKCNLVRSTPDA